MINKIPVLKLTVWGRIYSGTDASRLYWRILTRSLCGDDGHGRTPLREETRPPGRFASTRPTGGPANAVVSEVVGVAPVEAGIGFGYASIRD